MQMIDQHVAYGAGVTVAAIPVPRRGGDRVRRHRDRPATAGRSRRSWRSRPTRRPCPATPDLAYASMGIYVFTTDVLVDALRKDAADDGSRHDMGGDIVPDAGRARARPQVYDFLDNEVPGRRAPRRRVLARRRDAGLLLRGAHGPVRGAPGVQPVQRPVADPDPRAVAAAGQVRARQRRPGRPGDQQRRQQRRDRLRRPGPRLGAVARACGSTAGPGWSGPWSWTTPGSAGTRWSRTRSWTRTSMVPEGAVVGVDKEHDQAPRVRGVGGRHHRGRARARWSRRDRRVAARQLSVALLTREYPPEVYGGAGVHVEYLARRAGRPGRPHRALPGRRPPGRGRAPALAAAGRREPARSRRSRPTCP